MVKTRRVKCYIIITVRQNYKQTKCKSFKHKNRDAVLRVLDTLVSGSETPCLNTGPYPGESATNKNQKKKKFTKPKLNTVEFFSSRRS